MGFAAAKPISDRVDPDGKNMTAVVTVEDPDALGRRIRNAPDRYRWSRTCDRREGPASTFVTWQKSNPWALGSVTQFAAFCAPYHTLCAENYGSLVQFAIVCQRLKTSRLPKLIKSAQRS
jgi:hypothetical protein